MRSLAILLLCFPLTVCRAADFDEAALAKIPERMKQFVADQQIGGAVTVVGTSKGIVRLDTVGNLDVDKKRPLEKDSLFRIASMTKPITALGIMILVEEGKLKLDDPVEKYLPEFRGQMLVSKRDKDTMTLKKPSRPITLRDLLTHTSGLPGFPPGLADLYAKRNHTLAEATLVMSQRPLDFEPGSKWAYCNSGIDTLGRLIEVASGTSYESFLAKRIFEPLGLKDTTFALAVNQQDRLSKLYGVKDGKLTAAPDSMIGPGAGAKHPIPAGGLYSTGPDLAKVYQMMLQRGKAGEMHILREESVAEMTKVQTGDLKCGFTSGTGFGLGWAVIKQPEGVTAMLSPGTYGHGGAFGTQGWIDPHKDVFVVLLIQRVGLSNGDASEMRKELQRLVYDAIKK
jgi:CubicO group peptidase (beta-lactamase class C family)